MTAPADKSGTVRFLRARWRLLVPLGLLCATFGAYLVVVRTQSAPVTIRPLDPVPASFEGGRLERRGLHVVLHVSGTAEQMGRQHGTLLARSIRHMLDSYIHDTVVGSWDEADPEFRRLLDAVRAMRPALPPGFVREIESCASAAGVDPDVLLLAQCEGDIRQAASAARFPAACTSYVAFGPATLGGRLEAGRNFDYWVGEGVVETCALVTYYVPAPGEGCRFAAVGAAGILGGPTLVNEHGLVVAVHIPSRGTATRLDALPAFVLMRRIAQHAASVEEGIAMVREAKRMRGVTLWLAQAGDNETKRPARAVAIEYDAEEVYLREAERGVLIVTNQSLIFGGERRDGDEACSRYKRLHGRIDASYGRLDGTRALTTERGIAKGNTLHVVQVTPSAGVFTVWHGSIPAQRGEAVSHPMPGTPRQEARLPLAHRSPTAQRCGPHP
ncbi:MAG: C45 family autoproteolytic acyltransferase/hydrolase [Planctomycetota bacterium]|jgi:hypothetical protein